MAEYAARWDEAHRSEARIFFADEAHFRADAGLRGEWVVKGGPAPRFHEGRLWWTPAARAMAKRPAITRRCAWRPGKWSGWSWQGNSNSGTSVDFLTQLRGKHPGPLKVIWDNAPAHRGEAVREYLGTPGLGLRLVNLPGYSPDFNADEAIWGWAREEATGNLCLGSRAMVQERARKFLNIEIPDDYSRWEIGEEPQHDMDRAIAL